MLTRSRRTPVLLAALSVTAFATGLSGCGSSSPKVQSSGSVAAQGPASAQTVHIDGTGSLAFDPATITAKVGQLTIELGIKGGTPHNLEFSEGNRAKIPLVTGAPLKAIYTFTEAGRYAFVCTIHPGMNGQVVVS